MYCRYCGHQLNEEDRFCSNCGKSIDITVEEEMAEKSHLSNEFSNPEFENLEPADSSIDYDLEKLFIGKNHDYYFDKWDKIERNKTSWNWAAFLLGPFWFGYRKMYIPVFIISISYLFIDFLLYLFQYEYTEENYFYSPIDRAIGFAISIFLGFLGNYLYLKHTNKYMDNLSLNVEQKRIWLKKKGGTSWLGVLITLCIFIGYGFLSTLLFPTKVDQILSVKDGSFYDYPTTTIGDQFEYFFDETYWEYLNSDSPYDIVRFTGVTEQNGFTIDLTIDFILSDDSFEIHSATVNNEELTIEEINSLIDFIFTEQL